MTDDIQPTALSVRHEGVSWRIFEKEMFQKYFGDMIEGKPYDGAIVRVPPSIKYAYWKPHTEGTSEKDWGFMCNLASILRQRGIKMINDPQYWLACHAKEVAFDIWQQQGIPCPQWFAFTGTDDFFARRKPDDYPLLIRLNNSTSGWFSHLVHNDEETRVMLPRLIAASGYKHDGLDNTGTHRRYIAVEFIPTTRPEKVNLSFRIIVAGNQVVTGYARIGPAHEWIAITNRFRKGMEDTFVKYQKLCQDFIEQNSSLIVRAVQCLGLNFQGVDVILDQQDRPHFLEVQPGFSVGYAQFAAWRPPFYNPSRPPELRQFLIDNLERLKGEIPLYANIWLDKYVMFNLCFKYLKEQLG